MEGLQVLQAEASPVTVLPGDAAQNPDGFLPIVRVCSLLKAKGLHLPTPRELNPMSAQDADATRAGVPNLAQIPLSTFGTIPE